MRPPKTPRPPRSVDDVLDELTLSSEPLRALPRPPPRPRVPPPKPKAKPTYPDTESPTAARNRKVTLLETLVHTHAAIFDHIGEARMTDLIEVCKAFSEWDDGRQRLLLAIVRGLNGEKPFP